MLPGLKRESASTAVLIVAKSGEASVVVVVMKIDTWTLPTKRAFISSICLYMTRLAPSIVSETAIVMIMAMVIVTLRQSPTITSDRTYFARIGVQGSFRKTTRAGAGEPVGSAVHTARLVAHDLAALDLDDAATH